MLGKVVVTLVVVGWVGALELSITAYYPDERMVYNSTLFVRTSLDWTLFVEDGVHGFPLDPSSIMRHSGRNTWTKTLTYDPVVDTTAPVEITFLFLTPPRGNSGGLQPDLVPTCEFTHATGGYMRDIGAKTYVDLLSTENTAITAYPFFCQQHGRVDTFPNVFSPEFGNYRDIFVYVPPRLVENPLGDGNRIAAVHFVHDGQALNWFTTAADAFSTSGTTQWPDLIMVGIPSNENRSTYELVPTPCNGCVLGCTGKGQEWSCADHGQVGGGGPSMIRFMVDELLPLVMTSYGVTVDRRFTSVQGMSDGGLSAVYAVLTYNQYFTRAFGLSPALWWNCNEMAKLATMADIEIATAGFYLVNGGAEENGLPMPANCMTTPSFSLAAVLRKRGVRNTYNLVDDGGFHEIGSWSAQTGRGLSTLLSDEGWRW
mmetsp:Transcript_24915/g.69783  ORF Transcript_24915/g.69783 Transcript_24915/m.69783 type:complete len:428 (-) Transcript_24915:1677-2960(-)